MIHKLQIIAKCAKHMSKKICVIAFVIFILIFMMFYTARTLPDSKFKFLWNKYENKTTVSTTKPSSSSRSSRNAQKCIDFFSNIAKKIYGASKNDLNQIANLCEKIILPKFQTPKTLKEEHDVQVVEDYQS